MKLPGSIFFFIALIIFSSMIVEARAEQQNIPSVHQAIAPSFNQPTMTNISPTTTVKPFTPLDITAEKLSISGKTFMPVDITTKKLTISGRAFVPVDMITEKLTISGKAFVPIDVTTEKLSISGKAFVPIDITAEKLTISGMASTPVISNQGIPSVGSQGGAINKKLQRRGVR